MMRPNPRDPTPLETPSPARWLMALVGVAALFGGAGCSPDNICEENPAACPVLSCTPKESAQPVGDGCGVFVSPSLGVGDAVGSKAKPFKTIAAALSVVTTKRIYLCAEEINEAVSLRPGFRVYGGLSCSTGWGRIEEAETILTADPGTIPVTIAGEPITDPDVGPVDPNKIPDAGGGVPEEQAPVLLEDLRIVAKDAEDEGGSSIAVFAYDAVVEMNRCRIEAGNARDGKPGEGVVEAAAAGVSGNPGKAACSADTVLGGDEVANLCSMVMTP
ncbi:MAG: hypothetical protein HUU21_25575, partial [Polyangiaceae bacterium]|nr:hypothetical protein [Polyangiaceae bacterium]